jgi:branched-chain amino acid transport system ATP-binding protein
MLVEHHMDVVMPTCDRITVLNYGRKLADGAPAEIKRHPEVVKAYLGKGFDQRRARRSDGSGEVTRAAS